MQASTAYQLNPGNCESARGSDGRFITSAPLQKGAGRPYLTPRKEDKSTGADPGLLAWDRFAYFSAVAILATFLGFVMSFLTGRVDLILLALESLLLALSFVTCAALHRRYLAYRGLLPPFYSYDRIGDSPVFDVFRYLLLFGLGYVATLFSSFSPITLLLLSLVYVTAVGGGRIAIGRAAYPRPLPISTREVAWVGLVVSQPIAYIPLALQTVLPSSSYPAIALVFWLLFFGWFFGLLVLHAENRPPPAATGPQPRE